MEQDNQWVGINIQWDGTRIAVKYSDMTVRELSYLIYGALLEVPHFREALEIAIEKTKPKLMEQSERATLIYNLRLLRQSKGLNTIELAEELNFDLSRISFIENNPKIRIDPEEINAIAKHFNIDARTLLTVKGVVTFNKIQDDGKESKG